MAKNINTAVANERLFNALQGLADHLELRLVRKVIQKGKLATGRGAQSIEVITKQLVDAMVLTESHEDYMTFVDRGRKKGVRKVPISAIEEWLRVKNFSWAANNIRGAAFAVQTNIFKFGIKPTRWIGETLEEEAAAIEAAVSKGAVEQMELLIDNIVAKAQIRLTV